MLYKPPAWRIKAYALVNPIARRLNTSWYLDDYREQTRAFGAAVAFMSMGTNAQPAMPFLRQLLNDTNIVIRIAASNLVLNIEPAALKRATR